MKKTFGAKIGFVPYASVIIGTYDENNNPDAMNVGWAMQVGSEEVAINIIQHKTLDNLKINKAFTMAFVTKETLVALDYVGLVSAATVGGIGLCWPCVGSHGTGQNQKIRTDLCQIPLCKCTGI